MVIFKNQATAALRRVFFHCVDVTDGMTPETGEPHEYFDQFSEEELAPLINATPPVKPINIGVGVKVVPTSNIKPRLIAATRS